MEVTLLLVTPGNGPFIIIFRFHLDFTPSYYYIKILTSYLLFSKILPKLKKTIATVCWDLLSSQITLCLLYLPS
jgi:hypothetical protein